MCDENLISFKKAAGNGGKDVRKGGFRETFDVFLFFFFRRAFKTIFDRFLTDGEAKVVDKRVRRLPYITASLLVFAKTTKELSERRYLA